MGWGVVFKWAVWMWLVPAIDTCDKKELKYLLRNKMMLVLVF